MAQLTEALVRDILNGQGVTLWEIEQLCHFWLRNNPPADPGAGRDGWISVPRADWERMATCGCGCNRKSCPMCGEELLGEPAAEPPAHDTAISGAAGEKGCG